jgi:hypothetical protein
MSATQALLIAEKRAEEDRAMREAANEHLLTPDGEDPEEEPEKTTD